MYICNACIEKHNLEARRTITANADCESCGTSAYLLWVPALERSIDGDRPSVAVQLERLRLRSERLSYRAFVQKFPILDACLSSFPTTVLKGSVDDEIVTFNEAAVTEVFDALVKADGAMPGHMLFRDRQRFVRDWFRSERP